MKIKINIKTKKGTFIEKGTTVKINHFEHGSLIVFDVLNLDKPLKIPAQIASKYVTGIRKKPSELTLERWEAEGTCQTITGEIVEPDGYGSDGSPSWLIALGYL